MTDSTNPNLSSPSGSDMGEGTLAAFFAEREAYAELIRGKSNQHANGIFETLWKLREALRSTPSSTLTPDADERPVYLGKPCASVSDVSKPTTTAKKLTITPCNLPSATPAIRDQAFEEADVEAVARALARSHGLGDHMPNIEPWKRDARTALDAIRALKGTPPIENDDGR